jgi:hypothetical protein
MGVTGTHITEQSTVLDNFYYKQYLQNPGLNPEHSSIWIGGFRLRLPL